MISEPGSRGRRANRARGDDRQRAIVETLERLLEQRPLAEIGIDDLAAGAAISRPTFYFYFASKQAVLLELLDRLVAEIDGRLAALEALDPAEAASRRWWRAAIEVFVDVFGRHRGAAMALSGARQSSPDLQAVWAERATRWVRGTASVIEAGQRLGALPAGLDAVETAVALNAMNERVITASLAGERPSLPADRVLDVLVSVWAAALHLPPDDAR